MATSCCKLVGNFPIGDLEGKGIISVTSRGGTEMSKIGNNIIKGPTVGNISVTAYATDQIHTGCAGRAGLSLNWIRKYDCDNDIVYFIFSGEGKSYTIGDVGSLILLRYPTDVVTYDVISASASSGPGSIYQQDLQTDSYGLQYLGNPWPFTSEGGEINIDLGALSAGYGNNVYLQSFSFTANSAQIPTVTYDFVYTAANV